MNHQARKVAVITGAARGLGLALALELARSGFDLALIDRDEAGLRSVQEIFDEDQQTISIHQADVSVESEIQSVHDEILEAHGRVDLLINNAGVSVSKKFIESSQDDWDWVFGTNFWGTVFCCRHFYPDLLRSPSGRLATIVSGFALMGFPGKGAYAASKGALMSFMQVLSTELRDTRVKVSMVIPPPLDTGIVASGRHSNQDKQQAEEAFLMKNGMPLENAARTIVAGILRGRLRIVVGGRARLLDVFLRLMPSFLHRVIGRLQSRFDFS